uniref:Hemocyanin subunit e n=1 Tax=Mastigoproctus giganteus TaxID=58767 RepID=G8YZS2_MASGI|nr:hemocyanin subunit e [Mastigoproctus giganteus]
MTVKEQQKRILDLFHHLTSLPKERTPPTDDRLKGVGHLERGVLFSCFHETHLEEATDLYKILYGAKDFDDFMGLAKQARDFVNEGLFTYAATVAITHREDCRKLKVPPIQEIFPDRFVSAESIVHAAKEAINQPDQDIVVEREETGNILDPEHSLTYFREDVGVNAHHWHWHIAYPATWDASVMGREKDRKGELFYYMHQQMCARYDCERLSCGMQRMTPFHNFHEELEGYSPHLTSLISGLHYASRPEGFSLEDTEDVSLVEMIRWRERILTAIHLGHIIDDEGKDVKLDDEHGTDILGAIIEASHDSKNPFYYGSLHNWGHVMMAAIQDPDGRFKENPGVMSDTSTSLRDPIFYRYHRFVDNIFQQYKDTLHHYTKDDLLFSGIEVVSVAVNAKVQDLVTTFMKDSELELTYGINLGTTHSVSVRYHHLDHEPFTFNISVNNNTGEAKEATVRMFLGPKFDELGNRLHLDEQRRLYIELDKFHVSLTPGKNSIVRDHRDSNVTISKLRTVAQLREDSGEDDHYYCSCGWPEHMLIPRGNHRGMEFDLFVMLTDYTADSALDSTPEGVCVDSLSYCGIKDHKYPDKKPMGYPFDRPIDVDIEEFLTPNMTVADVKIKFRD